jgi:hypothetical protein
MYGVTKAVNVETTGGKLGLPTDCSAMRAEKSVQVTGASFSGSLQVEISNDNVGWDSFDDAITAAGMYVVDVPCAWLRVNASSLGGTAPTVTLFGIR